VGGTGQAIRLHLVSGDAPDRKKPLIRLAGRMRCQAPQRWVAPTKVDGADNASGSLAEWMQ